MLVGFFTALDKTNTIEEVVKLPCPNYDQDCENGTVWQIMYCRRTHNDPLWQNQQTPNCSVNLNVAGGLGLRFCECSMKGAPTSIPFCNKECIRLIPVRAIFCGDRLWINFKIIDDVISKLPKGSKIFHGDCRGADKISGFLAKKRGFEVTPEPADWDRYGNKAGPIRNRLMLKKYYPDTVIAFHNDLDSSEGTKDMVNAALEFGLTVKVYDDLGTCTIITPNR